MIEQVIDPGFVADRARQVNDDARATDVPTIAPPRVAQGRDRLRRRGNEPFIPRDQEQSRLQSALDEGLHTYREQDLEALPAVDPCGPTKPGDASDRAATERLDGHFGPDDVGWLVTVLEDIVTSDQAFPAKPPVDAALAADARVLLVGDWATGLSGAQRVGEQMRAKVDEARAQGREVHVIHLGDVYYCGRPYEYVKRMLAYWPVEDTADDGAFSWNLIGNHDMYSGGRGYFALVGGALRWNQADVPRSRLFSRQGGCSYFRIANEHWQILGLDTAYIDQQLHPQELAWLQGALRSGQSARTMLLSHHQLDSVYDRARVKGTLRRQLQRELDEHRVDAWFWGHEHRCIRYREFAGVRYPRCLGHGGVPEVLEPTLGSVVKRIANWIGALFAHRRLSRPPRILDEYKETWPADGVHWRRHGFACLDLNGPTIDVRYIDQCGHQHARETLE